MSDQSRTQNVTIDYDFKHTAKKIEIGWDDQYHPMDFSGGAWRGTFRGTLVVDGVVANPTKGLEIHLRYYDQESNPNRVCSFLAVNAYDHYVIRGSLCVKLDGKVTEPKAKQANLIPMTDNHTSYLGYEQRRFKGPDGVQKESIVSIECNFSYPAKDIRIRWDEKDHSIKKQEGKWVGVFEIKVDTAVKKISLLVDGESSEIPIHRSEPSYVITSIEYRIKAKPQEKGENHGPAGAAPGC